jgi:hypothetical protein
MDNDGQRKVEVTFDDETMMMLETCAAWRNVSVDELTRQQTSQNWRDELGVRKL